MARVSRSCSNIECGHKRDACASSASDVALNTCARLGERRKVAAEDRAFTRRTHRDASVLLRFAMITHHLEALEPKGHLQRYSGLISVWNAICFRLGRVKGILEF